jgi:hypothetical protein
MILQSVDDKESDFRPVCCAAVFHACPVRT